MGREIVWASRVGSTQALAMAAAEAGAEAGRVWVADFQTAGRGRRRQGDVRTWVSPSGSGLLFSIVLRPRMEPQVVASLTLAVAVACAQTLRTLTGVDVGVKWPNDLWASDLKLGGILTEGALSDGRVDAVVVGVGVNVNLDVTAVPDGLAAIATSLFSETGQVWDRLTLLTALADAIEAAVAEVEARGALGSMRARWEALSVDLGRRVRASDAAIEGIAQGLADDGGLRVLDDAGHTQVVRFGELRHVG